MRDRILALPVGRILTGLVAAAGVVFLVTALFGLFNPRDTSQPEGAVVAAALRVAHGEPLFLDFRKGPYVTTMYGPILYLLLGTLTKVAGAGVNGAYLLGRGLALVSALACAVMVGRLARRSGATPLAAGIAGGLFLASPIILPVSYSSRSDVPALALALLGMTLFTRWAHSTWRYCAVLPLAAAAFTKQTALAATLAIGLSLLLEGRIGRALLFVSLLGMGCAGTLLILNRATRGLAALNLLELPGASPLDLASRPLGALAGFLSLAWLPLILAAPALLKLVQGDKRLLLPFCYLLTALAVSLAASSKLGSDTYYFMEPLAATLMLAGAGLAPMLGDGTAPLREASSALLAGLFAVGLAGSIGMTARAGEYKYSPNAQVIRLAAEAPGDVLVEDENVALKCGKPVTLMDPFAFAYLERRGRWDPSPLNRRILKGDFGAIILRSPVEHPSHYQGEIYWAETTLEAMERAYRMEEKVDGYFVYRPRREGDAARVGDRS